MLACATPGRETPSQKTTGALRAVNRGLSALLDEQDSCDGT